jgi:hypothetical protein
MNDFDPTQITAYKFDMDKAEEAFEKDAKQFLAVILLRHKSRSFKLTLKGELVTDGISVSEYNHSIGLRLCEDDQIMLDDFPRIFYEPEFQFTHEYSVNPILKKDVLYLKLRAYKDKYRVKSDIDLDYKHPDKCALTRGDEVEVEVEVKAYLNLEEKKAGFILDLVHLKTGKPQPVKKRKT